METIYETVQVHGLRSAQFFSAWKKICAKKMAGKKCKKKMVVGKCGKKTHQKKSVFSKKKSNTKRKNPIFFFDTKCQNFSFFFIFFCTFFPAIFSSFFFHAFFLRKDPFFSKKNQTQNIKTKLYFTFPLFFLPVWCYIIRFPFRTWDKCICRHIAIFLLF